MKKSTETQKIQYARLQELTIRSRQRYLDAGGDPKSCPNEARWKKESIITFGNSIRLVIEVVSTNWSDDYVLK